MSDQKKNCKDEKKLSRRKFLITGTVVGVSAPLMPSLGLATETFTEKKTVTIPPNSSNFLSAALSRLSVHHTLWSDINKLCNLSKEIFISPDTSLQFYSNPKKFLEKYGLLSIDPSSIEIKLAVSLDDPKIREAVKARDQKELLRLLYERGLIDSVDTSALKSKIEKHINCQMDKLSKNSNKKIILDDEVIPQAYIAAVNIAVIAVSYIAVAIEMAITVSGGGSGYYTINSECISCGACVDGCPVGAIVESGDSYKITDDCIGCGGCIVSCPVGAIVSSSSSSALSAEYQSDIFHNEQIASYFSLPNRIKSSPGLSVAAILGDQEFMGKTTLQYIEEEVEKAAQAIESIPALLDNFKSGKELRKAIKDNIDKLLLGRLS